MEYGWVQKNSLLGSHRRCSTLYNFSSQLIEGCSLTIALFILNIFILCHEIRNRRERCTFTFIFTRNQCNHDEQNWMVIGATYDIVIYVAIRIVHQYVSSGCIVVVMCAAIRYVVASKRLIRTCIVNSRSSSYHSVSWMPGPSSCKWPTWRRLWWKERSL